MFKWQNSMEQIYSFITKEEFMHILSLMETGGHGGINSDTSEGHQRAWESEFSA